MLIPANLEPDKYVVAVSGGIDSVVLLDILAKEKKHQLVVAHFDHGIRDDSELDSVFVRDLAKKYGYVFESDRVELGSEASEALAREYRYNFLKKVQKKYEAKAIITAHHQDDLIETCFINIVRGTGRRGLTSLSSSNEIVRPLLGYPKEDLLNYASVNNLQWREDITNQDLKFLRNKLRNQYVLKMNQDQKEAILGIIKRAQVINHAIDQQLDLLLKKGMHKDQLVLSRSWFVKLPHSIGKEIIAKIVRKMKIQNIDKKTLDRLVVYSKTMKPGKIVQLNGAQILFTKRSIRFKSNNLVQI